jgi:ATP-dependent Lhr-like helicase
VATERKHEVQALWPVATLAGSDVARAYAGAFCTDAAAALASQVESRLEMTGPVTAAALAALYGVGAGAVQTALHALEARGAILRGRFVPTEADEQWCDRRLLARIHRYTLNRLRQEIEPVPAAAYMRFLAEWQHATPAMRLEGAGGMAALVDQLSGFEAPAAAWEAALLPQRLRDYHGALLDEQVRGGYCAWLRLSPKRPPTGRAAGTLRNTPLALVLRRDLRTWLGFAGVPGMPAPGSAAAIILDHIARHGASFFTDIVADTGLVRTQAENALDELAAAGLVTCDSFAGLRALMMPPARRGGHGRHARRAGAGGFELAGRWAQVARNGAPASGAEAAPDEDVLMTLARQLLRRYGVVCRRLLERESALPQWQHLLRVLRRLEGAGEIRGGRFLAGVSGEQYALPEAVAALREARRQTPGQLVTISAADPLNLLGIIVPGVRIPATLSTRIALLDGEGVAVAGEGEVRLLRPLAAADAMKVRTALVGVSPAAPHSHSGSGFKGRNRWRSP